MLEGEKPVRGWHKIGAILQLSANTVKKLAAKGMPVYREPISRCVLAYPSEIKEWYRSRLRPIRGD